jgi:hypothetical protein
MSKPEKKTESFIVQIAQEHTDYAEVEVFATSSTEAEELVSTLLRQGKLNNLHFHPGDDRDGPYTCDCRKNEGETPDCIIKDNIITFRSIAVPI